MTANEKKPVIAETYLHSIWMQGLDKIPKDFDKNQRSWVSSHLKHYYRVWDALNITVFIENNYPKFLSTYRLLKDPFQKMYFGQYLILYHFGGIMTHMDIRVLKGSLEHAQIFQEGQGVILFKSPYPRLKNFFDAGYMQQFEKPLPFKSEFLTTKLMASNKNHPFWLLVLKAISRQINVSQDDFPNYSMFLRATAGDLLLTKVWEDNKKLLNQIHVVPWHHMFLSYGASYFLSMKERFAATLSNSKNAKISKLLSPKPIDTNGPPRLVDELYTFSPPTNEIIVLVVCVVSILVALIASWLTLFYRRKQKKQQQ